MEQPDGLGVPTSRVSVAWMATVKPQGWVHAALGVGTPRPSIALLNGYNGSKPGLNSSVGSPGQDHFYFLYPPVIHPLDPEKNTLLFKKFTLGGNPSHDP